MVARYDTRKTADYSPYIVHFTRDRPLTAARLVSSDDPLYPFMKTPSLDKLTSILDAKVVYASPMAYPPSGPRAVCFTECIWEGLVELADRYSAYGIVLNKRTVFKKGGGPALYVRGDALRLLGEQIPAALQPMITPFDPDAALAPGTVLDWLHEREWRLPCDLKFLDSEIEYLIVNSIDDVNAIVDRFGTARFPRNKFVVMEVYRTIRGTWGGK